MYNYMEKSQYAGMTLKTKPDVGIDPLSHRDLGGVDFVVEDWWKNVYGLSWMFSNGNPACMAYAIRSAGKVPVDNDVLYGKVGGFGFLFHISELELPEEK